MRKIISIRCETADFIKKHILDHETVDETLRRLLGLPSLAKVTYGRPTKKRSMLINEYLDGLIVGLSHRDCISFGRVEYENALIIKRKVKARFKKLGKRCIIGHTANELFFRYYEGKNHNAPRLDGTPGRQIVADKTIIL